MDSSNDNSNNGNNNGTSPMDSEAAAAATTTALNVISLANRAISWGGNTVMGLTNSRRDTPVSAVSDPASAEDAEAKDQMLRKKIIQIHQDDSLSPGEKARRVQASIINKRKLNNENMTNLTILRS